MIGRVYKITSCKGDEIYVGSTFLTLKRRFYYHKNSRCYSKILIEKYGVENCKIELIKEYEVIDTLHLQAYEQLWINKYKKQILNIYNPFTIRIRKTTNCLKYLVKKQKSKEEIREQTKKAEKKWYEKNRERRIQKFTCECGTTLSTGNKPSHLKTQKHQDWLKSQN